MKYIKLFEEIDIDWDDIDKEEYDNDVINIEVVRYNYIDIDKYQYYFDNFEYGKRVNFILHNGISLMGNIIYIHKYKSYINITIEFDSYINAHDGNGKGNGKDGHCVVFGINNNNGHINGYEFLFDKLKRLENNRYKKPKALILSGSPGSGKGYILNKLNLDNIKRLNGDDYLEQISKELGFTLDQKTAKSEDRKLFMKHMLSSHNKLMKEELPKITDKKEDFILDITSASDKNTINLKRDLEDKGYDVMMLYVYSNLEDSLERNEKRHKLTGGRSIYPTGVLKGWYKVTKIFNVYKRVFGKNFVCISNTGNKEYITDIETIINKYISKWKLSDQKQKTQRELNNIEKLNSEIDSFLKSKHINDILSNTLSFEDAKNKIRNFFNYKSILENIDFDDIVDEEYEPPIINHTLITKCKEENGMVFSNLIKYIKVDHKYKYQFIDLLEKNDYTVIDDLTQTNYKSFVYFVIWSDLQYNITYSNTEFSSITDNKVIIDFDISVFN